MTKKKRKKPYFPNNWKAISDTPAEFFGMHLPTFEEFMDWKIAGYEIPSSISCIIREKRLDTGEVTEYVYQSQGHARNKARQIMDEGVSEFVVCTADDLHHVFPEQLQDYDDPLT